MDQQSNHICPLCGGPNDCAQANMASLDTQCWCREVTVNPVAIARAHKTQNNERCICKSCATSSNLEIQQARTKLYGTEFCHLCKEAETIIRMLGVTAIHIDIVEDEELFKKYSLRIPVLRRDDNNAELDWPFDVVTVTRFLM